MDLTTAVMIVEGDIDADEEQQIAAWQWLIDTGAAFQMQGSIGRQAMSLIWSGACRAPNPNQGETSEASD